MITPGHKGAPLAVLQLMTGALVVGERRGEPKVELLWFQFWYWYKLLQLKVIYCRSIDPRWWWWSTNGELLCSPFGGRSLLTFITIQEERRRRIRHRRRVIEAISCFQYSCCSRSIHSRSIAIILLTMRCTRILPYLWWFRCSHMRTLIDIIWLKFQGNYWNSRT